MDNVISILRTAVWFHLPIIFLFDLKVHNIHEDDGVSYESCAVHEMVGDLNAAKESYLHVMEHTSKGAMR